MPDVVPFRSLRYQAGVVGELADVLIPPYDALTDQVATALGARVARLNDGGRAPRSRWNLIELEAPGWPG